MKKKNKQRKNNYYIWILKIIIASFFISIIFSFIAEIAIPNLNIFLGILISLIVILIGVIFDMIGVAVTTADEAPFHSMASKKVKGAKMALKLKKNEEKVSSFCNDVVGDICGIISGSTGAVVALKITDAYNYNDLIVTLIVMGIISSLTIGCKAICKSLAIRKNNAILYKFSSILSIFKKIR